MKYFRRILTSSTILLVLLSASYCWADVSPGDVIDKTNWQAVQDMVPEPILEWLKAGEIVLNIDQTDYDPAEFANAHVFKSLEANRGKFALKDDQIVEVKTGQVPQFIEGLPFPEIKPDDLQAGAKLMYNRLYRTNSVGNLQIPVWELHWLTKKGLSRKASASYYQYPFDGYSGARDYENPKGLQRYQIYKFHEPYDIAGTAQMAWRYKSKDRDNVFGFLPSIRRVRRLTPANRSDGILGSDAVYDDAWGFDAKVSDFEWKVVRKQMGLIPYHSKEPQLLVKHPRAGYTTSDTFKDLVWGYDDPNWKGAAWFPTNIIWVKRPIYVLEARSKDPYYNLGVQYLWVDAETSMGMIKVMHDRAGKYWKTGLISDLGLSTSDGSVRFGIYRLQLFIDDRNKRATVIDTISSTNPWIFYGVVDPNIFSLAGFAKFSK